MLEYIFLGIRKKGPNEKYSDLYRRCYNITQEILTLGQATPQFFKNEFFLELPTKQSKRKQQQPKKLPKSLSKRSKKFQLPYYPYMMPASFGAGPSPMQLPYSYHSY
jgi:hypothetical protein